MQPGAMIFIDGENLLARFQAMLADGAQTHSHVFHERDSFVWTPKLVQVGNLDVVRVTYYTSQVGADDKLRDLEVKLSELRWSSLVGGTTGQVNARVFKKSAKSQKAASVDINIAIDVLRHCYQKDVGTVMILSGDGDYVPLVEEAMRTGTRVFVAALSSGLNLRLSMISDQFVVLDNCFFRLNSWSNKAGRP